MIMKREERDKIICAVEKTGYDFEHYVYDLLKNKGWQVISNRYYIDDVKGIEREIDLLAYKTKKENNVIFYTTLIISCKKSAESFWAFLTRQRPEHDPNTEYFLLHNHTTDRRLSFMMEESAGHIRESLLCKFGSLYEIERVPFAFQQINSGSGKTEDDKRIYESIITTIKALEYEKENRGRPIIENVEQYFYNFNLISIFDGKMYEVFFNGEDKEVKEISEIKYINRHIISKKESFYRVHFISKDALESQIDIYGKLSECNNLLYPKMIQDFYVDIFNNTKRVKVLWDGFCKALLFIFNQILIYNLEFQTKDRAKEFDYDYENNVLNIHFSGYSDIDAADFLRRVNECAKLREVVSALLIKWFRYEGDFVFDNNMLPF